MITSEKHNRQLTRALVSILLKTGGKLPSPAEMAYGGLIVSQTIGAECISTRISHTSGEFFTALTATPHGTQNNDVATILETALAAALGVYRRPAASLPEQEERRPKNEKPEQRRQGEPKKIDLARLETYATIRQAILSDVAALVADWSEDEIKAIGGRDLPEQGRKDLDTRPLALLLTRAKVAAKAKAAGKWDETIGEISKMSIETLSAYGADKFGADDDSGGSDPKVD